jgi:hypothetical protein
LIEDIILKRICAGGHFEWNANSGSNYGKPGMGLKANTKDTHCPSHPK